MLGQASYATHKSRKHPSYLCKDLKAHLIVKLPISTSVQPHVRQFALLESVDDVELVATVDLDCETESVFVKVIGSLLLKLESIYNVSGKL